MIPKKIHQVWLGDKEIPEQFLKWSKEWKEKNPDFEYKLWTSNDFGENKFVKEALKLNDYRFVSDWVRSNILYNEGGVYIDVDIKPYKPIPLSLLNNEFAVSQTSDWWYMNGFMASVPGSKGLAEAIREYSSYDEVIKQFNKDRPKLKDNAKDFREYFTWVWEDGQLLQRILPRVYGSDGLSVSPHDGKFINLTNTLYFIQKDEVHLVPQDVDPLTISRVNLIGIHRPKI